MLVTIPPHLSVSSFMGYYVDTVGRYEGAIKESIRNQLQEDIAQDTLNFKEYTDPFTGEPVK